MRLWITTLLLALTTININSMADYNKLIPIIKKYEGGWAGNIDGKQCTNQGITLETYRKYFGRQKTCKELRGITNAEWSYIFKEGYWDRWQADSIENQAIANLLVDWVFTSGLYGIKYPQAVLGVKVDGKVGPKTLAAINNNTYNKHLFKQIYERRKKHFEAIANNNKGKKKFLKGWLNRLSGFQFE